MPEIKVTSIDWDVSQPDNLTETLTATDSRQNNNPQPETNEPESMIQGECHFQFGFHHYYEPNTFKSAIRCADEKFWKETIKKEVLSIENQDVWSLACSFIFSNSSCHEPNMILGMKFEIIGNKILLSQPKHIEHGLEELGLSNSKLSTTPLTPNLKFKEVLDEDHALFKKENINYRSVIGLMNYITGYTRPDIIFTVSSLARFSIKPGMTHWHEVKKKSTAMHHGETTQSSELDNRDIYATYLELSFPGIALNPLVDSFHEGTWLKALLSDIWNLQVDVATHYVDDCELNERLMMSDSEFKEKFINSHYIDNKGLNDKLKNFGSNPKTRHIELKSKGIRQELKHKNIKIILICTFDMLADALTKAAPKLSISNLTNTIDPIFSVPQVKSL
ncbi:hypothetical protein VP01_3918g1 [Puccinia sorghi]|uniref:Reverse transcriptase Ty1/copia-type domain-containing protein n=1 Tax=Puccinia sorghi TaxID=27349 RepID=A0A0L6USN9_9BASI|nr:hypothetical protein VP01_3918g1 [Puccinia sorghi]